MLPETSASVGLPDGPALAKGNAPQSTNTNCPSVPMSHNLAAQPDHFQSRLPGPRAPAFLPLSFFFGWLNFPPWKAGLRHALGSGDRHAVKFLLLAFGTRREPPTTPFALPLDRTDKARKLGVVLAEQAAQGGIQRTRGEKGSGRHSPTQWTSCLERRCLLLAQFPQQGRLRRWEECPAWSGTSSGGNSGSASQPAKDQTSLLSGKIDAQPSSPPTGSKPLEDGF